MSYKMGLLLSIAFLITVFLSGADMIMINALYQRVDSIAILVAQKISIDGYLTPEIKNYVADQNAYVEPVTPYVPPIGGTYTFTVLTAYTPLILSDTFMTVRVTRSCVIGFYRPA